MADYRILITTSGIGSRLGNITKHTNKSLVRVGRKPAISYIIESYPEKSEFVITLGYYGGHIKEFLLMAYPDRKFTFVEVDKYEGEGSSLLYSMLCAKEYLNCPFIFHASDTIIKSSDFRYPDSNWIMYSNKENSDQYRTVNLSGGYPLIKDKGEIGSVFPYIGVCGVRDYEKFWEYGQLIYQEKNQDSSLSDCDVINRMSGLKWETRYCESWMDIGNPSELKKSRERIDDRFEILDKDDESIFIFSDSVIKFFSDRKVCSNRIQRGDLLKPMSPEIVSRGENFYKYEYCHGNLFSESVNEITFREFLNWISNNLWVDPTKNSENIKTSLSFYKDKTIERLNKYILDNIGAETSVNINGLEVPPVSDMLNLLDWDWLCTDTFFGFHGDLILDNVIEKEDGDFCLIDWRQDFGGNIHKGDMYYDLAKLNHNLLFNHDIVNRDLFYVDRKNNDVRCDILRSDNLTSCREILHSWVSERGLDLGKVKILTSIIWINMSPLHEKKMSDFLYFYGRLTLYKNILSYGIS